jgi:hypothetical protein
MGVVFLLQYLRDPDDLGIIMEVTGGGVVTLLSVIRLCRRRVPSIGPLTCMEVRT